MKQRFEEVLGKMGDRSGIREIRSVSGGDINQAYYVQTGEGEYFIKRNRNMPRGFFRVEADGLERIRATGAIAVPQVYGVHESEDGESLLILEWIEGKRQPFTEELLGRGVAALHQARGEKFGLERDGYIGWLPQPNGWYDRWLDCYRESRLLPQIELAESRGRMPVARKRKLMKLVESLERLLPDDCQPSLLHGDLWGGNWLPGPNGQPYLIDPAVLYGHSEFEIAFTELFGGFSETFYRSYAEIRPLTPEYEERKPLYQLYYLLVHLNMFGESYGGSVDRILARYVG